MPFWVSQVEGPVIDKIDLILGDWERGAALDEDAFVILFDLYKEMHGVAPFDYRGNEHRCPLDGDKFNPPHQDAQSAYQCKLKRRSWEHILFLIDTWFPAYINCFYSGYEANCRAWVNRAKWERPNEKYEVQYEY